MRARWTNVCPAGYLYVNYSEFSPNFPLLYRSPPNRTRTNRKPPPQSTHNTALVNSTTSTHVRGIHANKQFALHKCEHQYIQHNIIHCIHHNMRWAAFGCTMHKPQPHPLPHLRWWPSCFHLPSSKHEGECVPMVYKGGNGPASKDKTCKMQIIWFYCSLRAHCANCKRAGPYLGPIHIPNWKAG